MVENERRRKESRGESGIMGIDSKKEQERNGHQDSKRTQKTYCVVLQYHLHNSILYHAILYCAVPES
jgi:hypothetical protein